MKFLGQNDGLCKVSHRTAQPPAFASKIEISLLFGDSVAVLENSFSALDNLPVFQRPFHLQCLRNQSGILECKRRLSGDSLSEADFLRTKRPLFVGVNIQSPDDFDTGQQWYRQQGGQSG